MLHKMASNTQWTISTVYRVDLRRPRSMTAQVWSVKVIWPVRARRNATNVEQKNCDWLRHCSLLSLFSLFAGFHFVSPCFYRCFVKSPYREFPILRPWFSAAWIRRAIRSFMDWWTASFEQVSLPFTAGRVEFTSSVRVKAVARFPAPALVLARRMGARYVHPVYVLPHHSTCKLQFLYRL